MGEKIGNYILSLRGNCFQQFWVELSLENLPVDFLLGFAVKGWFSSEHDEQQDSKRPVIALVGVVVLEDFWSNVEGRSVDVGKAFSGDEFSGGAEITDFEVF